MKNMIFNNASNDSLCIDDGFDFNDKKRKNININSQKLLNNTQKCENNVKNTIKTQSRKLLQNQILKAYAKALLIIYPTIPNIVDIVDNIVVRRASSSISCSSIYSGSNHTFKQIEKLIDMTERKCKLLNIFSLIKDMIAPMNDKDYQIADMKFFKRMKISTIADKLCMDERSIYRRINKCLDSVVCYFNMHYIDVDYIESLIKGEGWIKEIYKKCYSEIETNKVRSVKNKKKKED